MQVGLASAHVQTEARFSKEVNPRNARASRFKQQSEWRAFSAQLT